ncbi:UNVERIFIED_CONTAM: hypothetical protein GTU68_050422 [Idotea baltica]|nr:hypothetical protein [Idotea baltica]
MTYLKSGTTWTQEIIWTLRNNPNLDNPLATAPINLRSPAFEVEACSRGTKFPSYQPGKEVYDTFVKIHPDRNPDDGLFLQLTELSPDPRTIKTHLPFSLQNPNILDTCKVSFLFFLYSR